MRCTGAIVSACLLFAVVRVAADVSGPWSVEFRRNATVVYVADCVWEQDGVRLAGGCTSGFGSIASLAGTVEVRHVTFELTASPDASPVIRFSGELNDSQTSVAGRWESIDRDGAREGGTFTATRRSGAADATGSRR